MHSDSASYMGDGSLIMVLRPKSSFNLFLPKSSQSNSYLLQMLIIFHCFFCCCKLSNEDFIGHISKQRINASLLSDDCLNLLLLLEVDLDGSDGLFFLTF